MQSKVETALFAEGVQLESFGGDIPVVHVSGLTGQGLPQLVETISLVAEMQDVRAEITGQVQGYVLESKVLKGLGYAVFIYHLLFDDVYLLSFLATLQPSLYCVAN